ncbi:hypothetical protein [Sphingobacterium sp. R2]|uniref:hypothetical protein n=1 Tax=Sphingobacterium sp. R2 TaxID=3112958 RepID=UPI00345CFEEB
MTYNTLFINRLVVISLNGKIAYDQMFHRGVNIIRGKNSSGKSTISNFLFYILGGDFTDFVPEAKRCQEVYAETEMNGAVITIRRPILLDENLKVKSKTPMYFFWGNYDEAINPPPEKNWQKFGYNSYPETKSFSNVIFDNLDIPIVKGDSNITIHQLLRLMYIDQDSPTSSLFLYEQFDSQITRETIAELLLGIYDDDLYQNRRQLISIGKEIDEIKAEIKATKGFFSDPLLLDPVNLETKIDNSQLEISKIENKIIELRQDSNQKSKIDINKLGFKKLSNQIVNQRKIVEGIKNEYENTKYEIADNEFFIASLEEKRKALNNSLITRDLLNNFNLDYCPECLSEIEIQVDNNSENQCKLCKSKIDSNYGITQGRRMQQELSFQIIESNSIQKDLKKDLEELGPKLKKELGILKNLQSQYDEEVKEVRSSKQDEIESLYLQKGFIEGEILQYRTMLENAEYYNKLLTKRDELIKNKDLIERFIRNAENQQTKLKLQIETTIKNEALYLLNNDLDRQDEFKDANEFTIDFSNNIAFLATKHAKYSASSNFYLKLTARFALFLASLSIPQMRYPRLLIGDNMEDKGIEEERAQNFQKIVIERLKSFDPNSYQLIFTTSYISSELENSDLVVGDFYKKDNRSLKNI